MKTAIYSRAASVDNESIAAQETQALRFAEQNGYDDCVCYRDNGASGLTLNRPGFAEMMTAIDGGEVGCVIVRDISRICRDYAELSKWLNAMEDRGVRLIAVNDGYDSFRTLESAQIRVTSALIQAEMKRELAGKRRASIGLARQRKAIRQAA